MNRKILFVINIDWFFLSHRLPIALKALEQGYQVHVATGISDKTAELQAHGLIVHPLPVTRSRVGLGEIVGLLIRLWKLFREIQPDVVHLITLKLVVFGGVMARLAGVPVLVSALPGLGFVFIARGIWPTIRRKVIGVLFRVALGHAHGMVICQNRDDLEMVSRLARLPAGRLTLIPGSGVALDQFVDTPLPTGRPVVLLAARMLIDKGVREFVTAARAFHVRTNGQGTESPRFVLVGAPDPGNPASLTRQELETWAREGVVEIWGKRRDMPKVLAAATIVVLPSYREGLPKVLCEAAACGRPVVTTDVPGCRDAVRSGVTGLLVPARDSGALAEAIGRLLADPTLCARMGRAGRRWAEEVFDVHQVVAGHLDIYERLQNDVGSP